MFTIKVKRQLIAILFVCREIIRTPMMKIKLERIVIVLTSLYYLTFPFCNMRLQLFLSLDVSSHNVVRDLQKDNFPNISNLIT